MGGGGIAGLYGCRVSEEEDEDEDAARTLDGRTAKRSTGQRVRLGRSPGVPRGRLGGVGCCAQCASGGGAGDIEVCQHRRSHGTDNDDENLFKDARVD